MVDVCVCVLRKWVSLELGRSRKLHQASRRFSPSRGGRSSECAEWSAVMAPRTTDLGDAGKCMCMRELRHLVPSVQRQEVAM